MDASSGTAVPLSSTFMHDRPPSHNRENDHPGVQAVMDELWRQSEHPPRDDRIIGGQVLALYRQLEEESQPLGPVLRGHAIHRFNALSIDAVAPDTKRRSLATDVVNQMKIACNAFMLPREERPDLPQYDFPA